MIVCSIAQATSRVFIITTAFLLIMPADRTPSPVDVIDMEDDIDMSSLSARSTSSSPTSELASLPPSSRSPSPTPSVASTSSSSVTDVRGRPLELGSSSTTASARFAQLDKLLDQTSLYSRFLMERMPTRYQHSLNLFSSSADRRRARTQHTKADTAASQSKPRHALAGDAEEVSDERYRFLNALLAPGRSLFMYQAVGVDWLISLFENGLNGVIADEMGLGKTLQTIVFLAHLQAHNVAGPFIIIAPLSTLSSWVDECGRWCPQLKVMRYHGNPDERKVLREQLSNSKSNAAQTPILITSYEIAMNDQSHLKRYSWKLMVVDEGHRLKNTQSKLLTTLKSFPTENRLLLTGTPLQNNLRELWSLLNFLLPTVFDSLDKFERWFDFDSVLASEDGKAVLLERERTERLISKLHDVLHPFVLRRLKVDVLQLPPKREYVVYCPMMRMQGQWYREIVDGKLRALTSGRGGLNMRNVMMQLQKVCDCPYLVKAAPWMESDDFVVEDGEEDEQTRQEADDQDDTPAASKSKGKKRKADRQPVNKRNSERTPQAWTNALIHDDLLSSCGKLQIVDKTIRHLLSRKQKLLIFSGFTRMLDLLATLVDCGEYGSSYIRIDGSTPAVERGEQVKAFNSTVRDAPSIALLSTRAAGLGINLASASTVILYDTDWNPQMDSQAMDRAHRLGSENDVTVLRLLTPASVEMTKYGRAQRKTVLTNIVMPKSKFKGEEEASAGDDGVAEAAGGGGKGEMEFLEELKEMFEREQRRLKGEEEIVVPKKESGGRAQSMARRKEEDRKQEQANIIEGQRGRRRTSAADRKRKLQEEEQAAQRKVNSDEVEEAAQLSDEEIAHLLRHELTSQQLAAHPLIELIDESEAPGDDGDEHSTAETNGKDATQ